MIVLWVFLVLVGLGVLVLGLSGRSGARIPTGRLEASGNFHRIQREYLFGDPPSTALGEQELRFRQGWLRERELAHDRLFLADQDGRLQERAPIA